VASASDEPRSDVSDANKDVARACVALRHCSHRPFPRLIRNHSCGIVGPRALDVFCRRHFFDWISCCVSLGASSLFEFSAFSAATVWMVGFGLATLALYRSGMPMPLPLWS